MPLVLSPPPAVVALLQYQDPGPLGEGQLVGLLRLVVVLDHGRAQRLGGLHAARARRLRPGARADRGAVGGQGLGAGTLFHLLFDTGKRTNLVI